MRYVVPVLLFAFARPALADEAAKLSARVDAQLAAKWQGKVEPAPAAADSEFFRRLSLDRTGRVSSLSTAKDFLDDDPPDKRRLWADEFLDGPEFAERYAAHFATRWRAVLLDQANPQLGIGGARLEDWLRRQFRANAPYGLLTDAAASEYFSACEGKAENVAGATSRALLGVRLECAQCHDDRGGGGWTRDQFWEYAAFFFRLPVARLDGNMVRVGTETGDGPPKIKVPDKDALVSAKFLDGAPLDWKAGANAQAVGEVPGDVPTAPDRPLDTHASIQQALFLMNGTLATTATGTAGSRTLVTILGGAGPTADKVGELFVVVLSRKPTAAESKRLAAFVEATEDKKAALADVFWVLLNSTEFAVNH